jgi:hypothetical protein
MRLITMLVPRLATGAAGVALGAVCALMAWEMGLTQVPGFKGQLYAAAFASVVVGSWFLPTIARSAPRGYAAMIWSAWLIGTAFVLANAIANTAHDRDASVGTAKGVMVNYDLARREYDRLEAELEPMKLNPRWALTAGCTNDTAAKSIAYCGEVHRVRVQMDKHRATLSQARPVSADSQADRLSLILRVAPETVTEWQPIGFAIGLDLLASLFMTIALLPIRRPQGPPEAPKPAEDAEPAWVSSSPLERHPWPRYGPTQVFGRIDGRKLRWMPTNPRLNDNDEAA